MSLKLEIDSRPKQEDFDIKVQQCNALRLELSNLTEQMTCNEKLLEQMQMELSDERERRMEMLGKRLEERSIQTEFDDLLESTKEVPVVQETAQDASSSAVLSEAPQSNKVSEQSSSTEMPQSSSAAANIADEQDEDDDVLNNHPKVLYEDELIVFKEKCTNLTSENVRLQREVVELRANLGHFSNSWLHNFLLKYLVPVLIVFVAYIFYLLK